MIVDAHTHIGSPLPSEVGRGYDPSRWRGYSHHDLLRLMDAAGVDVAVLHTNDLWAHPYHRRVVEQFPTRLCSVYKIDDLAMTTGALLQELSVALQTRAYRGCYFDPWPATHPAFSDFHAKRFTPLWSLLSRLEVPVCFVNYGVRSPTRARDMVRLLDSFPDLRAILVHGLFPPGKRPPGILRVDGTVHIPDEIIRLVQVHDVHLEVLTGYIDGDFGARDEIIHALYETFGAAKLIWGSEFVKLASLPREQALSATRYRDQLTYLERRCPFLNESELALILGGNAQRVYGLSEAEFAAGG